MTSQKKIEANRQNALKSTGPKTLEGKEAVRMNALRHGILARQVLLPGEDEEALRELGEGLRAELQPVGELENRLVDRVIAAYWRLQRVGQVEVGIFAWERSEELRERAEREARHHESSQLRKIVDDSTGNTKTDKKKQKEALSRARELMSEQESEIIMLGRTFARDADAANAFSKLSRYETAIDRQLYRALHQLERLQAARSGGNVPAPLVADIDVSGIPEGNG